MPTVLNETLACYNSTLCRENEAIGSVVERVTRSMLLLPCYNALSTIEGNFTPPVAPRLEEELV